MFLKSLLNKLKPKRKPKFNIDEKLRIGRELGNIIDFRTKHTEYRWTAIYEYLKRTKISATIDEMTDYFLHARFTRYELADLTTSDSITFKVLENISDKFNVIEAFDSEIDTITNNLKWSLDNEYKVENLHDGSIRVTKIYNKGRYDK